jgi:hypothetical protein
MPEEIGCDYSSLFANAAGAVNGDLRRLFCAAYPNSIRSPSSGGGSLRTAGSMVIAAIAGGKSRRPAGRRHSAWVWHACAVLSVKPSLRETASDEWSKRF